MKFTNKSTLAEVREELIRRRDEIQAQIDYLDGLTGAPEPTQEPPQRPERKTRPRAPAKPKKARRAPSRKPSRKKSAPATGRKKKKQRNLAGPTKEIVGRDPSRWWEPRDLIRVAMETGQLELSQDEIMNAVNVLQITLAKWCREGKYERQANEETGRMMYRPKQS